MAKITYITKQPIVDPENPQANEQFFASDANEVKTSVNALYDNVDVVAQNAIDALATAQVAQEDIDAIETTVIEHTSQITELESTKQDNFTPITENQVGEHPAFATWNAFNLYVLANMGAGAADPQPAAPTSLVADDILDTLTGVYSEGFTVLAHEYTLTGGTTLLPMTLEMDNGNGTFTIPIPNSAITAANIKIRVKADGARPVGFWATSPAAFTVGIPAPAAPINPITNDYQNKFFFTEVI